MRKVALSAEAVAIPSVAEICRKLTELLEEAVGAEKPSLVLLSGGLDTSIIALLAKRKVERLTALTIAFDDESEDLNYAQRVARFLSIQHEVYYFDSEELKEAIKTIPPQYKIRRERDKLYGKWILRKAFEGYLPRDIVWREKVPFDRGCGVLRCAQGFFQSTTP